MKAVSDFEQKQIGEHLPPRNENVLIKTRHFRRMAFLDFSGVWRWTENNESVAEQVLAWERTPINRS